MKFSPPAFSLARFALGGCLDCSTGPKDSDPDDGNLRVSLGVNLANMTKTASGDYYQDLVVGTVRRCVADVYTNVQRRLCGLADERHAVRRGTSLPDLRLGQVDLRPRRWYDRNERSAERASSSSRPRMATATRARGTGAIPANSTLVFRRQAEFVPVADPPDRLEVRETQHESPFFRRFIEDSFVPYTHPPGATMSRSLKLAVCGLLAFAAAPLAAQTNTSDPVLRHIWALGMDSSHTWDLSQVALRFDRSAPHGHAEWPRGAATG